MKKRYMVVGLVILLLALALTAAACGGGDDTTTTAAPTATTAAPTATTAAPTGTTAAPTDTTAAGPATTAAAAGPATGSPITIGMCAPQTGAFSSAWPMQQQGIQVALDLVNNNGGINGHPLAITIVDDKSDPTVAVSQMTKLITQDKVPVVLGSMAPPAGQAMMPLAGQYKVVQIRDVPTIKEAADTQPYVFFTGESSNHITKSLLQQIKVAGWKNILAIGDQIPLCQDILSMLKDQVPAQGGAVDVMADSWPLDITDVTPIVNKIWAEYQKAKPDVLFLMATNDCVPIIKALKQKGLTIPIQCPPAAIMPALFNMGNDVVEGLYVLGPGITDPTQLPADFYGLEAINAFQKAFVAKFNEQPSLFAADGNDKVATIVEALKKAGDGADGTKIAAALETLKDFPEVQGTFTFTAQSHVGLTGPLCEWQVAGGKYKLVQVLNVNN
jgi:branched-chain amino acid transport system substrate-binding protein